jgi:hypothetical protein
MLISNASYVPTFLYLATKRVNARLPSCSRAMICFVCDVIFDQLVISILLAMMVMEETGGVKGVKFC